MQKMIPTLTDRQRYWLAHVQACEAAGKTIVEYAAAQEFCAHPLSIWRFNALMAANSSVRFFGLSVCS